jgi:hypothetical protein
MTSRVFRAGAEPNEDTAWQGRNPADRIAAVWDLTLLCSAWGDNVGEPRLQRSVGRVQRRTG